MTTKSETLTFILGALIAGLLSLVVAGQENTSLHDWPVYSPSDASFSLKVPQTVSHAQGYIFDPDDDRRQPVFIRDAVSARVFNFEVQRGGQRRYLTSILDVVVRKGRSKKALFSQAELDGIHAFIGDDIEASKILRKSTPTGDTASWSYKRSAGLRKDVDDDGRIYVKTAGDRMIIVVVAYDFAKSGDKEIDRMLESLTIVR